MPRGYLGDQTHDAVVDFLVANGVLLKDGDWILGAARYAALRAFVDQVEGENLFVRERKILTQLREVRVTKAMLGVA